MYKINVAFCILNVAVKTYFTQMNISESTFLDGIQSISSHEFNGSKIANNDVNSSQVEHAHILLWLETDISGSFTCEACNKLACEHQSILIQPEGETMRLI